MKPFYSIQELADILDEDIYTVADGLSASGVEPRLNGEVANLSRWESPITDHGNGNVYIITGRAIVPDPKRVIVSSDALPQSWRESIRAAVYEQDTGLEVRSFDALVTEESAQLPGQGEQPEDWRLSARVIADEFFKLDTDNNCRDSLANYSNRVMYEMQKRKIYGPRGLIDNPKTIQREALQAAMWWAGKAK